MSKRTKRLLDIVISAALLVATSPVLLLSSVMVWLRMGKPLLFQQERAGLLGRTFTLYKLRTMSSETDECGNLLPVTNRLTPFGRALRRLSIDELPQLWNVLKGDMSLIGPRPLLASYLPRYNDSQRRRHLMKPGITGYAQVMGRNALTWEAKFELDTYYVEHWSLWLDIQIAAKTVWTVLSAANTQEGLPSDMEFLGSPNRCAITDGHQHRV
jgi:sugar transferase EpsL